MCLTQIVWCSLQCLVPLCRQFPLDLRGQWCVREDVIAVAMGELSQERMWIFLCFWSVNISLRQS